MVADTGPSAPRAPADPEGHERSVEDLVGDWAYLPDVAERCGIPLSRVRRHLADRELLALRVGPNRALAVPARFIGPSGPRPELKGTFTVLADGGMSDPQILRWLFTPDATLPVPGAPVDSLLSGHKTEVRRRAQELAF
ncbi:MAG: Rv2175c family DNA-binding protein [Dermatophilaceae bacterium]